MTTNTTIKPTTRTTGSSANDKSEIKMLNNNNKNYKYLSERRKENKYYIMLT